MGMIHKYQEAQKEVIMNKILIVSAHPDDETLGCGGTILKHKSQNDKVFWLILTNIDTKNGWDEEKVKSRQKEIDDVAVTYGFEDIYKLDFPTTTLDIISMNDLIKPISGVMNKIKPNMIYLPFKSDIHTDHQVTFDAVMACTKTFRYPDIRKIMMYECLSETEFAPAYHDTVFIPNYFVDISDYFNKKIEIMKNYSSEIMSSPYPRSLEIIEAQAKLRGSRIGKKYAEAFSMIFEIS